MTIKIRRNRVERKAVLIALEDTKSSKFYFSSMVKDFGLSGKVVFAKHIGTNPSKVLCAITDTNNYKSEYEKCWIVFDKDDFLIQDYNGTLDRARSLNVCTALSNESYELWLLLHFERVTGFLGRESINRKLSERFVTEFKISYEKSISDIYPILKSKQAIAIKNAEYLIAMHSRDNGCVDPFNNNPITYIQELIKFLESLRDNVKNDCKCFVCS